MRFTDRVQAGRELAVKLERFKAENVIVLALPRGGVILGHQIARALGAGLDLAVVRKIGAPENPEYAIGAIDEEGDGVWNEYERARVDPEWLKEDVEKEKNEARRRLDVYRLGRPSLDLRSKTVLLVDDGVATGLTMRAAIRSVRRRGAARIVVAVAGVSRDLLPALEKEADEVVALTVPTSLWAVGELYESFPQVEDEEVVSIMKEYVHR